LRIAVSGTHCSGKSTLIADFLAAHREYIHEPEPYVWLDELYGEHAAEEPGVADFYRQLEVCVERLRNYEPGADMIAERSPLDFLAYILALHDLGDGEGAPEIVDAAVTLVESGLAHLDVLIVLPLNGRDGIEAPSGEDPELREAMNDRLIEIVDGDELGLLGKRPLQVAELHGTPQRRLATLEQFLLDAT
jgi:AAA domain